VGTRCTNQDIGHILSALAGSETATTDRQVDGVKAANTTHITLITASAPAAVDAVAAPAADQPDAGAAAAAGCHQSACSAGAGGVAAALKGLLHGVQLGPMSAGRLQTCGIYLAPAMA
jgi:hypothetical protein